MTILVIALGVLGWRIISDLLNRRERTKLINRLMARNYQEFEYYDKQYKGDLKTLEKTRNIELDQEAKRPSEELNADQNRLAADVALADIHPVFNSAYLTTEAGKLLALRDYLIANGFILA